MPEYLYAKMVAGYTPGVPVLGTISTIGATVLLLGGYAGHCSAPTAAVAARADNRGERETCSRRIDGKSVVVTGASKGIGKGIARVFARHGAKVLVVARHRDEAEARRRDRQRGGTASGFAADVRELADMEAMAQRPLERHGGIDILCANAGIFPQAKTRGA